MNFECRSDFCLFVLSGLALNIKRDCVYASTYIIVVNDLLRRHAHIVILIRVVRLVEVFEKKLFSRFTILNNIRVVPAPTVLDAQKKNTKSSDTVFCKKKKQKKTTNREKNRVYERRENRYSARVYK